MEVLQKNKTADFYSRDDFLVAKVPYCWKKAIKRSGSYAHVSSLILSKPKYAPSCDDASSHEPQIPSKAKCQEIQTLNKTFAFQQFMKKFWPWTWTCQQKYTNKSIPVLASSSLVSWQRKGSSNGAIPWMQPGYFFFKNTVYIYRDRQNSVLKREWRTGRRET